MEDQIEGTVANRESQEQEKEKVVVGPHTIAHPRAVVVVHRHAAVADRTVPRQRRLHDPTLETHLSGVCPLQYWP